MINKDDFTLSVIIPCFNELKTIRAIVDRVRNADVKKMEIIIVDDCSVDGTRALLESRSLPWSPGSFITTGTRARGLLCEPASPTPPAISC